MRGKDEEMKKGLSQEIEISPIVEKRIQEIYKQLNTSQNHINKPYRAVKRVVAAAAIIFALSGTTALAAYASGNADFLRSIFGSASRSSNDAEVRQIEDGKGGTLEVTIPANEYVPMDADTYKELEPYVQSIGKTFTMGEHTVTVLSHITDGSTGVVSYKLECSNGIDMLDADEEKNRDKGADFSVKSKGFFCLEGVSGASLADKLYIDTEKSTDTCYYLYQSYVCDGNGGAQTICINKYNQSYEEAENTQTDVEVIEKETVDIKAEQMIKEKKSVKNGKHTVYEVSSLGLSLDLKYLDGFKEEVKKVGSIDPYQVKSIVIQYTDGSDYVVYNQNTNIDNTNYLCGGMGESKNILNIAFNRIVDIKDVKDIEINGNIIR